MKQKNLVLMVVAVGCGLVAAFLTSQMSARSGGDTVDVIVASKDLPVGTLLTKEDIQKGVVVKRKKMSKDSLPPGIVETEEEIAEKRLTRGIRAEETINKADLSKGMIVQIPQGMHMSTLPIGVPQAVAGFVGPGSRVDILATVRLGNKITAFPLMVNMLVLAVDTHTQLPQGQGGAFQSLSMVSFAVDRKQALLIKLAQTRGCDMSLMLRGDQDQSPNDDGYDIEKVIKLLQDEKEPAKLEPGPNTPKKDPEPTAVPPAIDITPAPSPVPAPETVNVPVALVDIEAGREITADLLDDPKVFGTRELPKELAEDAITDLKPYVGKALKNGLGKGQWVTKSLVGDLIPKGPPPDVLVTPKTVPADPKPRAEKKETYDVAVHGASGTRYYRYEKTATGEWKLVGEVSPNERRASAAKAD